MVCRRRRRRCQACGWRIAIATVFTSSTAIGVAEYGAGVWRDCDGGRTKYSGVESWMAKAQ